MENPSLLDKARLVLKSLGTKAREERPPVPEPPADEDRLDTRVEDASPTEEDLNEAKDDHGDEGEGGEGDGFDEHGHKDMDPESIGDGEGGAGDDKGEQPKEDQPGEGEKGDEDDPEGRGVKKAFPHVGHIIPDEDELLSLDEGSKGFLELSQAFASIVGKQNAVLDLMMGRLEDLQKGMEKTHEALKAQGRSVQKALTESADLKGRVDRLHETAPAAKPRAVAKSLGGGGSSPQPIAFSDVDALSRSGQMSSRDIAMLCQTGVRGTSY